MLWNEWVKLSVFYWITQYEGFYIAKNLEHPIKVFNEWKKKHALLQPKKFNSEIPYQTFGWRFGSKY